MRTCHRAEADYCSYRNGNLLTTIHGETRSSNMEAFIIWQTTIVRYNQWPFSMNRRESIQQIGWKPHLMLSNRTYNVSLKLAGFHS